MVSPTQRQSLLAATLWCACWRSSPPRRAPLPRCRAGNDGKAKQYIITIVEKVTTPDSLDFGRVPQRNVGP
jgi:hypothetical protein